MLKNSKRFLHLWAIILLAGLTASAQIATPQPQGLVNDFANKLSPAARQRLENQLKDFRDQHGIEIAVVTIPFDDLKNNSIERYTLELARNWKNNFGLKRLEAVLLIAMKGNKTADGYQGQTRLEVSRALEDDLSDGQAGEIIRGMRQDLRAGRFDEALNIGVQGIFSALEETYIEASDEGSAQANVAPNVAGGRSANGASRNSGAQNFSSKQTPMSKNDSGWSVSDKLLYLLGLPLLIVVIIGIFAVRMMSNPGDGRQAYGHSSHLRAPIFDRSDSNYQQSDHTSSWHNTSHFSHSGDSNSSSSSSDSSSSSSSDSSSSGGGSTDSW